MPIDLPEDPVLRVQAVLAWTLLHQSNVAIRRGKFGNYIVYNSSRQPNFIVVGGERRGSLYSFPRAYTSHQCRDLEDRLRAKHEIVFNEPFRGSQHRIWMDLRTNRAVLLTAGDVPAGTRAICEVQARELGELLADVLRPKSGTKA